MTAPAAAAELTAVGDGGVREVDLTYDVRITGVVATVTARQELRATADAVEAVYAFALPADAAIIGLAVTPPGGEAQRGAAVDGVAAITAAADRDTVAMAADLGLVRRLGAGDGTVGYELRVYPVTADASTVVELTWVAPMAFVDGRLTLRIPDRGDRLGAVSGTVTVSPPVGVKKLRDLHAGGALLAAKPGDDAWPFVGDGEVVIDVAPVITKPVVSYAASAGALTVTVLRPRADSAPTRFDRALFVVDTSSSNASEAARDAMAALVDGVIGGLRADAEVQAVLFDRTARTALAQFTAATTETRATLKAAIADATGQAGTDLVGALAAAHDLLDGRFDTLVVIVTDGVLPTDADARTLEAAIDSAAAISAVLVGPDELAPPDPAASALAELAASHGGRVVAARYGEAAARASTVASEIGAGEDWPISIGNSGVALAPPDTIAPGSGWIGFGWYRGDAPDALTVVAGDVELTAKKAKKGAVPRIGALAIAGGVRPLLDEDVDVDRAMAKLERKLGVVGVHTAIVAVDREDELAAARLDLAARGGTFSRIPPPPEAELEVPEPELSAVTDPGARYHMDTEGRIRNDLIGPQLLPAAHACFDAARALGAAPTGTVTLEIEVARGEVIAARAQSIGAPELVACLREAAYTLTVPSYTFDDAPDVIYLIRYPVSFATKGAVAIGDDTGLDPIDLGDAVDQPLGGLHSD